MLIDVTPLQAGHDKRNNVTLGELLVGEFGTGGSSEAGVAVALPRGLGAGWAVRQTGTLLRLPAQTRDLEACLVIPLER